MKDKWNRKINYMRISVTDRCNLRCCYCMPEEGIPWLEAEKLLSFEEIERIVKAGVALGIDTIKITGGEPLLRKNISALIKHIKETKGIRQVTLTTNGVLLKQQSEELKVAGIDSINVNLPALSKEAYAFITRRDEFLQVKEGIEKAFQAGIRLKLNCVARADLTDEELKNFGEIAKRYPIDIRFIEMMPLGFGKQYETYENDLILKRMETVFEKTAQASSKRGNGPAVYYDLEGFLGKIGFVSAVTHKFCDCCNRIRLSSTGDLKLCLQYETVVSLKEAARRGDEEQLKRLMKEAIFEKPKAHCFYESTKATLECKNMVQIGG